MHKLKRSKAAARTLRHTPTQTLERIESRQLLSTGSGLVHSVAGFALEEDIVTAGDLIFADGNTGVVPPDISLAVGVTEYDTLTHRIIYPSLSVERGNASTISVGGKVIFAGGDTGNQFQSDVSSAVDIYDTAVGKWSTAQLSVARDGIAAVTVKDQVIFAGGVLSDGTETNAVDVYNAAANE
jgi:hypothetical protein